MSEVKPDKSINEEERYVLTPWGCLSATLSDYDIDYSHLTPTMGKHLVEDFMKTMVSAGHVIKKESMEDEK